MHTRHIIVGPNGMLAPTQGANITTGTGAGDTQTLAREGREALSCWDSVARQQRFRIWGKGGEQDVPCWSAPYGMHWIAILSHKHKLAKQTGHTVQESMYPSKGAVHCSLQLATSAQPQNTSTMVVATACKVRQQWWGLIQCDRTALIDYRRIKAGSILLPAKQSQNVSHNHTCKLYRTRSLFLKSDGGLIWPQLSHRTCSVTLHVIKKAVIKICFDTHSRLTPKSAP
jgi:hypothetical protein